MSSMMNEDEDGMLSKKQLPRSADDDFGGNENTGVALKKGPWTAAEDAILMEYVKKHGEGNWNAVQKHSGLSRCGKSCRLRWANHLRPNLKKGAFTQEEEKLIIELHAKMGNKWARMAAHLPGRTDNEIKNYWNTRVKRCQRAGLPLYLPAPPLETFRENLQGLDVCGSIGNRGHLVLLPENNYEMPNVVFDNSRANQGLMAYDPELSDITRRDISLSQYHGYMYPTRHRHKRLCESTDIQHGFGHTVKNKILLFDQLQDDPLDKVFQSFGLAFPPDPDPTSKNLVSFGENKDSPVLSDGNFSASKPTSGTTKLELPSLQYPETVLHGCEKSSDLPIDESTDTLFQSPHNGLLETYYPLPHNSGLLDALLHEAKARRNIKNHTPDQNSNSSTVADVAERNGLNISAKEWEDYGDVLSPMGHTSISMLSNSTTISASGSSSDEQQSMETFTGCNAKTYSIDKTGITYGEKQAGPDVEFTRPDTLLVSDWLERGSGFGRHQDVMTDAIAALLGDDLGNEYKQMASESCTSTQGLGIGFFAWNNMASVYHISGLPLNTYTRTE